MSISRSRATRRVPLWAAAAAAIAAPGLGGAQFTSIFNGHDLSGWDGNPAFWSVQDGAITGITTPDNPTAGNTFLIWRGGELGDFTLRLKYRIRGGNSGVQYRSRDLGNWVVGGYQADIDATNQYTGILYEERGRGILALRGTKVVVRADGAKETAGATAPEAEIVGAIKPDDWNQYEITAVGNRIVQTLNGHVTVEFVDEQESARALKGILALQLHAGPPMTVQFKEIELAPAAAALAKVVFVAGAASHGHGSHEHKAGCLLLADWLEQGLPGVETAVHSGWPGDPAAFDGAAAIVIFSDGGGGHVALPHLDQIGALMDQGVGLACLHYAVEVPKGRPGQALLDWIGGYFETFWSVNPHWNAEFKELPDHPITRGVKPFAIDDEWYYHMRFRNEMAGVTPILTAIPPESTRQRPDDAHGGNPVVRARTGMPEHVAWAATRSDGGRGFGFTGGHWHVNWAQDDYRTVVLNAIAWIAKLEVPEGGVPSRRPTADELLANQDEATPAAAQKRALQERIDKLNAP